MRGVRCRPSEMWGEIEDGKKKMDKVGLREKKIIVPVSDAEYNHFLPFDDLTILRLL